MMNLSGSDPLLPDMQQNSSMRFSLAAIVIESSPFVPAERFLSIKNGKKANVQITLSFTPFRHEGVDERRCADGMSVYFLPGKGWLFEEQSENHGAQLLASTDYSRLLFHQPATVSGEISMRLLRLPLECRFAHEGVLSLHAACVDEGGRAVCFTGDSGIGKSTRAKVWAEALGAEFISGDRPAIRLEADGCTACGVPWDGKEQIFRNVEHPLRAILEVRRAPFTRLRRLAQEQAYRALIRQCFIPMWDTDAAALAMQNVRRLSRSVPVYRLFCGPDAAAAKETYHILFEAPEIIREELPDMQIKENFILRNIGNEHMVMPTGENIAKFGGAVVLSDTAAFIFEQLKQPTSREDLLTLLLSEFDVDAETAAQDLDELLTKFKEMGFLEV